MSIPASLTRYVAALHVYDVSYAAGPGIHVGMPSTTLTFVLPLDEPLVVSWADDPSSRGASWASVSGVHARPAAIHHTGSQRGIQLALTTAGARVLFGVPASELAGGSCGYADHAHLTREWGRLAGCSPTTWLATEFPNVQAIGA